MTVIQVFFRHARLVLGLWILASPQIMAGFSAVYVLGDGVSNTNNAPTGGGAANYHGNRFCNGLTFVEVLSRWQAVTFDTTKNISNFGNDSGVLITNVNNLAAPADSAALYIVWANNADFVDYTSEISSPYGSMPPWTTRINQSLSNHVTAITNLYNKGARKIVVPNAVDIMRTPFYNVFNSADRSFARQRIIEYNQQFKTSMTGVMVGKPGLEIILPDTFSFFEQVLANPAAYGMVNFNDLNAGGIDSEDPALNGIGAQYVFWDDYHPTAKFQMHLAAFIQQTISPVKVNSMSLSGGNLQIQVANIPLTRAGSILGSANLQPPWAVDQAINEPFVAGGSTTKTYTFAASGPKRFYRAAFPVVWTWP